MSRKRVPRAFIAVTGQLPGDKDRHVAQRGSRELPLILRTDYTGGLYEANETNNDRIIPITISP